VTTRVSAVPGHAQQRAISPWSSRSVPRPTPSQRASAPPAATATHTLTHLASSSFLPSDNRKQVAKLIWQKAAYDQYCLYFTVGRPFPHKVPPFPGIWIQYVVPWAYQSAHPKGHLDWFSRFCRARDCDRQTDRQTGQATSTYVVQQCSLESKGNALPVWGSYLSFLGPEVIGEKTSLWDAGPTVSFSGAEHHQLTSSKCIVWWPKHQTVNSK